jgi:hypothetical protein
MDRWNPERLEDLLGLLVDATKTLGALIKEDVVPPLEDLRRQVEYLQNEVGLLSQKLGAGKRPSGVRIVEIPGPKKCERKAKPIRKKDANVENGISGPTLESMPNEGAS